MMNIRRVQFILFAGILCLAGCRPTGSAESARPVQSPVAPAAPQTVARVHWLGMQQLSDLTNAAHFVMIWNLPESRKLEQQTLDKSSLAPWRLLHRALDTNTAALFRPLLDDVVANESYLEIRQATNLPEELVFAVRLDDQRAALWQTNLAKVLESLTGIPPVPAEDHQGWLLKKHHAPNVLELTRAGEWTIVGAAEDSNALVAELRTRIQRGLSPWEGQDTNVWLEADLNPAQLCPSLKTLNFKLPGAMKQGEGGSTLDHVHLTLASEGTNVLTQATADFSGPLGLDLEPWNIATNLIDSRLSSFTLIRGFRPWLASSQTWTNLQIGPPPNQICFWALQAFPMQSYFTAPLAEASNEVDRLTDWVLQNQHRWFVTNDLAKFVRTNAFPGFVWKGVPYMTPFVRSITVSNQDFIFGGGIPNTVVNPLSLTSLSAISSRTNLVYHEREITGLRIEQWIYMGQFARFVSHKAQVPPGSPALDWLHALAPKLGETVTDITETGPNQLSFTRKSNLGLTGIELNLLADWLESPQFPIGLNTFQAPPPLQP